MRPTAVRMFAYLACAAFAVILIHLALMAGPGTHASIAVAFIACVVAVAAAAGRRSAEASRQRAQEQLEAMMLSRNEDLCAAVRELRRETTEHAGTRAGLRECERRLGLLAGSADDWIFSITGDLRFSYVSPSCERITGYAPEEFIRDPSLFLTITHPEDRGAMADHLESPPGPGETSSFDYRIIHRNGEIIRLHHKCRHIAAGDGEPPDLHMCNRDVTERRMVDDRIRLTASSGATPIRATAAGDSPADKAGAHADCAGSAQIRAGLELALARNEFAVFYQPLVNIASGQVTAVEALIRWRHPTRGLLAPADFMNEAEATGMIIPIGMAVLRQACAELAGWDSLGIAPLRLCVNLSLRQLRDPSLPDEVSRILQATGIDPRRIEFEINEGTAMSREHTAHATMNRLRFMGLHLSLDNYGSGASSLHRLMRLPLESIKIDRSFVQASTHSEHEAAAARGVINMARSLRMKVVAAGVEKPDQLEFLRREGCGDYQGFLFSPPLPGGDLEKLLAAVPRSAACNTGAGEPSAGEAGSDDAAATRRSLP